MEQDPVVTPDEDDAPRHLVLLDGETDELVDRREGVLPRRLGREEARLSVVLRFRKRRYGRRLRWRRGRVRGRSDRRARREQGAERRRTEELPHEGSCYRLRQVLVPNRTSTRRRTA